jgi:hypothetical protein
MFNKIYVGWKNVGVIRFILDMCNRGVNSDNRLPAPIRNENDQIALLLVYFANIAIFVE